MGATTKFRRTTTQAGSCDGIASSGPGSLNELGIRDLVAKLVPWLTCFCSLSSDGRRFLVRKPCQLWLAIAPDQLPTAKHALAVPISLEYGR